MNRWEAAASSAVVCGIGDGIFGAGMFAHEALKMKVPGMWNKIALLGTSAIVGSIFGSGYYGLGGCLMCIIHYREIK